MEPNSCRTSCSVTVQYFWDAILFIKNQKHVPNFERIAHYLKRIHNVDESDVKTQLKHAVNDGLLLVSQKIGNKGSRIGLKQDVYSLPNREVKKPSHDWYCFECHRGGKVYFCASCHRAYHPYCCNDKPKKTRTFICRICKMLLANSNFKIRREELNVLLSYTCKRLKVSEEEGKPCLATFCLRWVPGDKAVTPSETQAFPYQSAQETGVQKLVFDNKDDWRHAFLIHQYMDLVMMQEKVHAKKYRQLEEFEADAETIVHNVVIYHGVNSPITNMAKQMLKDCIYDLTEIRQCRDCYRMSNQTSNRLWFCRPCDPPHELVFAKQTGFPYWPAKVIKVTGGVYDVRFFGGLHQRANIEAKNIKSINFNINSLSIKRSTAWNKAFEELKYHQSLLSSTRRETRSFSILFTPKDTENEQSDDEPQSKKQLLESDQRSKEAKQANAVKNRSADMAEVEVKLEKNKCNVRLKNEPGDSLDENIPQQPMETDSSNELRSESGNELEDKPGNRPKTETGKECKPQVEHECKNEVADESNKEAGSEHNHEFKNELLNELNNVLGNESRNGPSAMIPVSEIDTNFNEMLPKSSSPLNLTDSDEDLGEPRITRSVSRMGNKIKENRHVKNSVKSTIVRNGEQSKSIRPSSRLKNKIETVKRLKTSSKSTVIVRKEKPRDLKPGLRMGKNLKNVKHRKAPMQSSIKKNEDTRPSSRLGKKTKAIIVPKHNIQAPTVDCQQSPKSTKPGSQMNKAFSEEIILKTCPQMHNVESDGESMLKNEATITSSTRVNVAKPKQTSSTEDVNVVSSSSSETPIFKCSVMTQTRFPVKRLLTRGVQTEEDGEQSARSLARAQAKAVLESKLKAEEELKFAKEKLIKDLTQKLEKKYAEDKERTVITMVSRVKAEMQLLQQEAEDRLRASHAEEIRTVNQRHQHLISEVKKKQWCYNCEAEAIYHCCWNTSYCSIECQQIHWQKEHKRSCRRKR